MPGRSTLILISARWPLGVLITAWAYMWRTTPLHRRERPGSWEQNAPRPLPPGARRADVQEPGEGAGPLLHRRYHARILDADLTAEGLMARLGEDPNRVAPGTLAHFVKVEGDKGRMAVGDEFIVRMPGPWDGPVRVVEVTPLGTAGQSEDLVELNPSR